MSSGQRSELCIIWCYLWIVWLVDVRFVVGSSAVVKHQVTVSLELAIVWNKLTYGPDAALTYIYEHMHYGKNVTFMKFT